jgi:hypothetical protein
VTGCAPWPRREVFHGIRQRAGGKGFVGSLSDSGISRARNGESFGKYAQIVLTGDVNCRGPSDKEKQKDYVMRKLTPTLTQSGLLAVLLERQRYKTSQLALRRAQHKHMQATLWSTLILPLQALTVPVRVRHSRRALRRIPPAPI